MQAPLSIELRYVRAPLTHFNYGVLIMMQYKEARWRAVTWQDSISSQNGGYYCVSVVQAIISVNSRSFLVRELF